MIQSFPNQSVMKKAKRILVWFQQDLRLHDNEALTAALEKGQEIIPVYVFDPRIWKGKTPNGIRRIEAFRAKFILESVADLRNSFQKAGIDLLVRVGFPETEIPRLASELETSWVFAMREPMPEEAEIQSALEKNLWKLGQELHYFRGKLLYHTDDLPFPVPQTPDIFTNFRKEIERGTPVRLPLEVPQVFPEWTFSVDTGNLPALADFGLSEPLPDERAAFSGKGGETEGLKRLQSYFWESHFVLRYEETRNGLIGMEYSTKFSPWLAQGCLSPKFIYQELKRFEKTVGSNKSTYWLYFELLWRDYFRLIGKKYGKKMFTRGGIKGKESKQSIPDWKRFVCWQQAQTGEPWIDAHLEELRKTGFLSNRGRQNVASFLVNDLKLPWQWGAEYFEAMLIDYDVCSNWGNWNYLAGVGNDPREDRYFHPQTQAKKYDPEGKFIRLWLSEHSMKV